MFVCLFCFDFGAGIGLDFSKGSRGGKKKSRRGKDINQNLRKTEVSHLGNSWLEHGKWRELTVMGRTQSKIRTFQILFSPVHSTISLRFIHPHQHRHQDTTSTLSFKNFTLSFLIYLLFKAPGLVRLYVYSFLYLGWPTAAPKQICALIKYSGFIDTPFHILYGTYLGDFHVQAGHCVGNLDILRLCLVLRVPADVFTAVETHVLHRTSSQCSVLIASSGSSTGLCAL